jgi:Fic family protein
MKSQIIQLYDSAHQFEPLLPSPAKMEPLLERASDLTRAATALGSSAMPTAHLELRALLRSMNSYYTNRIEGEHTRPSDIDRALLADFSSEPDLARKQRLALAHIRTEQFCEEALDSAAQPEETVAQLYTPVLLKYLHHELFCQLPAVDLTLGDGSLMVAGALRTRGVAVGRHEAPTSGSLPAFIARWGAVYGGVRRGEAAIVAAAAAHHRLAWMHPFLDGNGRVARLHTHLLMHAMGLSRGLWSPLRGFARSEERYKALLQAADQHRRGDLDGRGNLSQAALIDWITYSLDIFTDQANFMAKMLDIPAMKGRIAAALSFEEQTRRAGIRVEALRPLHYLFAAEFELSRADFKAMTTLGDRVATETIAALCREGFLVSDSPYGKLRFGIPPRALRFYFPALWPEAEQDAHAVAAEQRLARTTPAAKPAPKPRRRKGLSL